ncbi:unnamed protein product [Schistosoma turkestanicum]|nr:unnamed protein product [Schistosoma turkestanicum]
MDELDNLLNELHQTNQKILQKNNALNLPSDCGSSPAYVTKIDQQYELDPNKSRQPQIKTKQAVDRNGDHSNLPQPRSVRELNKMLASLDNFDYLHTDQLPQAYYSYNHSEKDQSHETSGYHINNSTLVNNHSDYDLNTLQSNEQTMLAAKEAERQLDDLLHSLKQFKINNHHQSDSGAELPSSMSNSFIDNSSSDNHQRNSQTLSHKSSTLSNHKIDIHNNTMMNGLNSYNIRVDINNNNNNNNNDQDHHDDEDKYHQNSNRRVQRQNAKRIISPNSDQMNNVSPKEQSPDQLLNSMLNDLSIELSQHGAKTNPRGQCYACKKPINGTLITAIGKEWHPEHFTCASCRVGLVRQDFYERDDQAYCTQCHLQMFSPRCGFCGEAVVEKCVLALARAWHPHHFFCYSCHSTLNGSLTVHERNDKPYCSNCYFTLFGTPCSGCQQPITDAYITALDMPWHKDCFTCHDCNRILTGTSFHEVDGYPYCDSHYYSKRGLLCFACSLPITGRCVNALGKRYHPEHFLCAYCLHPLQTGTFKEHLSKPYCHQCFTQLFG